MKDSGVYYFVVSHVLPELDQAALKGPEIAPQAVAAYTVAARDRGNECT